MTEIELIKGLKFLGLAYGKEFDQDECQVYYEFLKDYSYDAFRTAVKGIIKKSKFLPKINELCEECEKSQTQVRIEILEFMKAKGYFKAFKEYEKAYLWFTENKVPEWLQKDANEYYKMMKQEMLDAPEQLMIGG